MFTFDEMLPARIDRAAAHYRQFVLGLQDRIVTDGGRNFAPSVYVPVGKVIAAFLKAHPAYRYLERGIASRMASRVEHHLNAASWQQLVC